MKLERRKNGKNLKAGVFLFGPRVAGVSAIPGHIHYDWEHDNAAAGAHSHLAAEWEGPDRRGRNRDDSGCQAGLHRDTQSRCGLPTSAAPAMKSR